MNLMSVGAIRLALNEVDYEDVNKLLRTSLAVVTTALESTLQTEFALKDRVDIFRPNAGARYGVTHSLNLRAGAVNSESVVVQGYTLLDNAVSSSTEGEVLSVVVPSEMGVVHLLQEYSYRYYRVDYSAGFSDDGSSYVEGEVPEWLRAACIQYTKAVYAEFVQAKIRASEGIPSYSGGNIPELPNTVLELIKPYIRWNPTALKPVVAL